MVLISQKKWDKVNMLLRSLRAKLEDSLWVDYKELEMSQGGGDLCFVELPTADPILKGPASDN
jgi:hypothetical protein